MISSNKTSFAEVLLFIESELALPSDDAKLALKFLENKLQKVFNSRGF